MRKTLFFLAFLLFFLSFGLGASAQVGWDYNADTRVVRLYNNDANYYFDRDNGIQWTQDPTAKWTINGFSIGRELPNGDCNIIKSAKELHDFDYNISTDNQTFVKGTLWKDISYSIYDFRLGIQYFLRPNDIDLNITVFGKNLGIPIPFDLCFDWNVTKINIANTLSDQLDINRSHYQLESPLNLTFKNMGVWAKHYDVNMVWDGNYDFVPLPFYFLRDKDRGFISLQWNPKLDYTVKVFSDGNQQNAYINLDINAGRFAAGQQKTTELHWRDPLAGIVEPNGDTPVKEYPNPAEETHYDKIDDGIYQPDVPEMGDGVYSWGTNQSEYRDIFDMETLADVSNVSNIKIWAYGHGFTDSAGLVIPSVTNSIRTSNTNFVIPLDQNYRFNESGYGAWHNVSFDVDWTQSQLDNLQVLLRSRQASVPPCFPDCYVNDGKAIWTDQDNQTDIFKIWGENPDNSLLSHITDLNVCLFALINGGDFNDMNIIVNIKPYGQDWLGTRSLGNFATTPQPDEHWICTNYSGDWNGTATKTDFEVSVTTDVIEGTPTIYLHGLAVGVKDLNFGETWFEATEEDVQVEWTNPEAPEPHWQMVRTGVIGGDSGTDITYALYAEVTYTKTAVTNNLVMPNQRKLVCIDGNCLRSRDTSNGTYVEFCAGANGVDCETTTNWTQKYFWADVNMSTLARAGEDKNILLAVVDKTFGHAAIQGKMFYADLVGGNQIGNWSTSSFDFNIYRNPNDNSPALQGVYNPSLLRIFDGNWVIVWHRGSTGTNRGRALKTIDKNYMNQDAWCKGDKTCPALTARYDDIISASTTSLHIQESPYVGGIECVQPSIPDTNHTFYCVSNLSSSAYNLGIIRGRWSPITGVISWTGAYSSSSSVYDSHYPPSVSWDAVKGDLTVLHRIGNIVRFTRIPIYPTNRYNNSTYWQYYDLIATSADKTGYSQIFDGNGYNYAAYTAVGVGTDKNVVYRKRNPSAAYNNWGTQTALAIDDDANEFNPSCDKNNAQCLFVIQDTNVMDYKDLRPQGQELSLLLTQPNYRVGITGITQIKWKNWTVNQPTDANTVCYLDVDKKFSFAGTKIFDVNLMSSTYCSGDFTTGRSCSYDWNSATVPDINQAWIDCNSYIGNDLNAIDGTDDSKGILIQNGVPIVYWKTLQTETEYTNALIYNKMNVWIQESVTPDSTDLNIIAHNIEADKNFTVILKASPKDANCTPSDLTLGSDCNYNVPLSVLPDGNYNFWVTYYNGVNRRADLTGYHLVLDKGAPVIEYFDMNNGAATTDSETPEMTLFATDVNSPISKMKFSCNDSTYTPEMDYDTNSVGAFSIIDVAYGCVTGDGDKNVFVKIKDLAGNWSASTKDTIELDTGGAGAEMYYPDVNAISFTTDANYFIKGGSVFTLDWNASDDDNTMTDLLFTASHNTIQALGGTTIFTDYNVAENPIFCDSNAGTQTHCYYDWTVPNEDANYYFIIKADEGGRTDWSASSRQFAIDSSTPTTTATNPCGNDWNKTKPQIITLACTDGTGIGCKLTRFKAAGSDWNYGTTIVLNTDGNHLVQYESSDLLDQNETTHSTYCAIDTNAPITTSDINHNVWQNTDANVHLVAADTNSGVATTKYRQNSGDWTTFDLNVLITAEGSTSFDYNSTDNAGNIETTNSKTIKIDKTAPITTASGCTGGWKNANQTITLACDDNSLSGCLETRYRISEGDWQAYATPFELSADGNHKIDFNSSDNIDNQEAIKTMYCAIDKTAPTLSEKYPPANISENNALPSFWVKLTDTNSGEKGCYYKPLINTAWGTLAFVDVNAEDYCVYTQPTGLTNGDTMLVQWRGVDNVDNNSADLNTGIFTYSFVAGDTTAPTTTSDANDGVWQNYDANVHLTCDDGAGTGCASTMYRIDGVNWVEFDTNLLITTEGETTLDYNSTDANNNVEATNTETIKIDKTAPTVFINQPIDGNTQVTSKIVKFDVNGIWFGAPIVGCNVDINESHSTTFNFATHCTESDGNYVCSYTEPLITGNATWKLIIACIDATGNTSDENTSTFDYNVTAPVSTEDNFAVGFAAGLATKQNDEWIIALAIGSLFGAIILLIPK